MEKKTFVDIERSFKFAISIRDAGTICPPLTAESTLFIDEKLPVYSHMVPDGLVPSFYSDGANVICNLHVPSFDAHYNDGSTVSTDPSTDGSSSDSVGGGTEDSGNPSDGGGNGETSDTSDQT